MKCPYCDGTTSKVVETRSQTNFIRRRRKCDKCGRRFTTEEAVRTNIVVIKSDGTSEEFDRQKLIEGIRRACKYRPISQEMIQEIAKKVERRILEEGLLQIESRKIGEFAATELKLVDWVAYVRFMSVFGRIDDLHDYEDLIDDVKDWLEEQKKEGIWKPPKERSGR